MSAFMVRLKHQPGELVGLCDALAARGANLVLCAMSHGDSSTLAFVTDDEAAARTVLDGSGVEFTERAAITVRMDNVPGAGAAAFRRLADAGVTMDLLIPVRVSRDQFFAVVCVDDLDAATRALGEQVVGA